MKTNLTALSIAVIGLLSLGISMTAAGDRTAGQSCESVLRGFDVIKPVADRHLR